MILIEKIHLCILQAGRIFEQGYGGEERFAVSLSRWMLKKQHEVTLVASGFVTARSRKLSIEDNLFHKADRKTTQNIRAVYPPYLIYSLSRFVMCLLWVFNIIPISRRCPINIIHAQDTGYAGLAAVLVGRLLRVPVILSSHGIRHKTLESILKGKFSSLLIKMELQLDLFNIKRANAVIAVNPAIKEYYENLASKSVHFIPIPIALKDFQFDVSNRKSARDELNIGNKEIVLGYVGRFSPEKNINSLLESFSHLLERNSTILLVLVGSGGLEPQFSQYVKKRGISDKVIFCGARRDIGRILSAIDIFVLPSYVEGLSTSLLEAMACARCIVCSNIIGNRHLITNWVNGVMIDPHNSRELDEAIQKLLDDEKLRSTLGLNAMMTSRNYDEDIIFERILNFYSSFVAKK